MIWRLCCWIAFFILRRVSWAFWMYTITTKFLTTAVSAVCHHADISSHPLTAFLRCGCWALCWKKVWVQQRRVGLWALPLYFCLDSAAAWVLSSLSEELSLCFLTFDAHDKTAQKSRWNIVQLTLRWQLILLFPSFSMPNFSYSKGHIITRKDISIEGCLSSVQTEVQTT